MNEMINGHTVKAFNEDLKTINDLVMELGELGLDQLRRAVQTLKDEEQVILELLSDGKWHEVETLLARVGLSEQKFAEVTGFLCKYDFVMFDEEKGRVY